MGSSNIEFASKVRKLDRKHARLSRGMTSKILPDGLMVARPRRRQFGVSARGVALMLASFFGFKTALLLTFGEITYTGRVAELASGTAVERAGAWVMQVEPVTAFFASFINYYL